MQCWPACATSWQTCTCLEGQTNLETNREVDQNTALVEVPDVHRGQVAVKDAVLACIVDGSGHIAHNLSQWRGTAVTGTLMFKVLNCVLVHSSPSGVSTIFL